MPPQLLEYISQHAHYSGYHHGVHVLPELLPDVGPVKARNMVKARDQVGVFASMDELNSLAKIKGAELLAQRFVEEMEDKTLVPRLIELLLPVEA